MKRLKRWLIKAYLPEAARQAFEEEYKRALLECDRLRNENERLRAYIDGTAAVLRRLPKIRLEGVVSVGSD